ncbi:MAG: hypothetical protein Q9227_007400 [Pyrenula ochraceoflavens]
MEQLSLSEASTDESQWQGRVLHPDSRSPRTGGAHKFPRDEAKPHDPKKDGGPSPATHPHSSISRETTVVRIPLKSAKHHFGVGISRGSRVYNEDAYQAGVIEIPAFAKRPPASVDLQRRKAAEASGEGVGAEGASGDPQVFYFGIFDGHGGSECSDFLRSELHEYIEQTGRYFELESSLPGKQPSPKKDDLEEAKTSKVLANIETEAAVEAGNRMLNSVQTTKEKAPDAPTEGRSGDGRTGPSEANYQAPYPGDPPLLQGANRDHVKVLEKQLVHAWKELVGGYFRRFKPAYFSLFGGYQALAEESEALQSRPGSNSSVAIEEALTYAFLKADFDFVSLQARKPDAENPSPQALPSPTILNDDHIIGSTSQTRTSSAPRRFKGGSTCSVALISTPTPTPFWNPSTPSTMLIGHVGDTRILVCATSTGAAIPLTTNHHPSSPVESNRLRRYAATFVTDSFGEERMSGLANTRAFGDIGSKRMGVSAEPEIKRVELGAAEFAFLVLVSDGVSGALTDQEIVDIVKEAKTPDQASKDLVAFATEVGAEGDNATCLVIRLGGWERRSEGGGGSLGTAEKRRWMKEEASDPRGRRR